LTPTDVTRSHHTFDVGRRGFLGISGGTALALLAGRAAATDRQALATEAAVRSSATGPGWYRTVRLEQIGRYESGLFDEGGAEIVDYHAPTRQLFVVNADLGGVDVLDVSDPTTPTKVGELDVAGDLEGVDTANSVSVSDGAIAVAIGAATPQDPGRIGFYDPVSLTLQGTATVGALPDKVTFTPDGTRALVANEGEPSEDYSVDPQGSVSIVDISAGADAPTVETADFSAFVGTEDDLRARGIRVFGPGANAAQDFEPEYVTVSDDSSTAWVSLQENNAIAVVDIAAAEVTDLLPLGFKDHRMDGNELDASNEDDAVTIRNWPVFGILQPDSLGTYTVDGEQYIVTANEGDSRDYDGFSEEAEVADLELDPSAFDFSGVDGIDSVEELQRPENLGAKGVTTTLGDVDGDGQYEEIYVFGGRSFSIFSADGDLVFDSGSDFEDVTADRYGIQFNNDNAESDPDGRSDNKGPEPEGLTIGRVHDRVFAFVGLERIGGVMTYDVTDPEAPEFVDYVNNRDFSVDIEAEIADGPLEAGAAGDLGPEGLAFATADESPIDDPLVFVGHEVSGTTVVFRVTAEVLAVSVSCGRGGGVVTVTNAGDDPVEVRDIDDRGRNVIRGRPELGPGESLTLERVPDGTVALQAFDPESGDPLGPVVERTVDCVGPPDRPRLEVSAACTPEGAALTVTNPGTATVEVRDIDAAGVDILQGRPELAPGESLTVEGVPNGTAVLRAFDPESGRPVGPAVPVDVDCSSG
jgi:hypothetical protein